MPRPIHLRYAPRVAAAALALAIVADNEVFAQAEPFQFLSAATGRGAPIINPDTCTGGLRNDDGSFEGAVGYANAVERGAYVMALPIPAGFAPRRVCLCWTRGPFNNGPDVDFDVVFYRPDGKGPKGEPDYPGSEMARVPSRAENVPEFQVDGVAMYPVELPAEVANFAGMIYVGAEWQPFVNRQFFLCNDAEVGGGQLRPVFEGYSNVPPEPQWSPISELRPTYRAFGTVVYGEHMFANDFEDVLLRGDFECAADRPGCSIH